MKGPGVVHRRGMQEVGGEEGIKVKARKIYTGMMSEKMEESKHDSKQIKMRE